MSAPLRERIKVRVNGPHLVLDPSPWTSLAEVVCHNVIARE
jgi:hypothetical protein